MPNGLNFSARYSIGLSNIIEAGSDGEELKNNTFQLFVGYYFN